MSLEINAKYIMDLRLIVVVSIFSVFSNFSTVQAVPIEQMPVSVKDFLEESISDYHSDKIRIFDAHPSGMICVEYEKGVERIRVEMLNRTEYMKDTRVNLNTTSRTTSNTSVLTFT